MATGQLPATKPLEIGLIPVQSGTKTPFFCVYGNGRVLAQYLDPDQPVYWFWSSHHCELHQLSHSASIEEIAAFYLKEIKRIQPEGPYLIGGFCVGASIAYEIAQQLKRENQQVPLLTLIDPWRPGPVPLSVKVIRELNKTSQIDGYLKKISYLSNKATTLSRRAISRFLKKFGYHKILGKQTSPKPSSVYVHPTATKALVYYQPQPYKDPVLLFWPGQREIIHMRKKQLDPPAHWIKLLTGDIKTFSIPEAGHEQLFDELNAQDIARQLNKHLRDYHVIAV